MTTDRVVIGHTDRGGTVSLRRDLVDLIKDNVWRIVKLEQGTDGVRVKEEL